MGLKSTSLDACLSDPIPVSALTSGARQIRRKRGRVELIARQDFEKNWLRVAGFAFAQFPPDVNLDSILQRYRIATSHLSSYPITFWKT